MTELRGRTAGTWLVDHLEAELGGYKLSIHSGSDKLAIYGRLAEVTRRRTHLKTSGTSWLEALRVLSAVEPALFRTVWAIAADGYAAARASYHVSGAVENVPRSTGCPTRGCLDCSTSGTPGRCCPWRSGWC